MKYLFRGFTLVELMMAIAILAILAMIAIPSFIALITNNRVSSQVNLVIGSINVARSEAVKHGRAASLCASSNGTSCTGTDLGAGWIVFDDIGADGTVDTADTVIKIYPAMPGGMSAPFTVANITFLGTGRPVGAFSGANMNVCPPAAGDYCRYICINSQGRPRVITPQQFSTDTLCGN